MKTLALATIAGLTIFGAVQANAADAIHTGTFSNIALSGYDTVAYFTQGKPVKGSSEFTTEYQGAKWQFANAANLATFKSNPTKYAPQYGGYCAWAAAGGNLAAGNPQHWDITDGKLYLNYNQSIQDQWLGNKANFIADADKKFSGLIK